MSRTTPLAPGGAEQAGVSCPSVDHVLAREDGGLARIRVPGGRIGADRLDAVASVAERWGNGVVELTNRANLQMRGVAPGDAGQVAEVLIAAGVSGGDAADRRRNILLSPLSDLDPEAVDLAPVLDSLLAGLDADPRLDGLDDKFGFALDGGGRWGLGGRRAAVVVTPASGGGAGGTSGEGGAGGTGGGAGGGALLELRCGWAPPRRVALDDLARALVAAALESLGQPRSSQTVPVSCRTPRVAGPLGDGGDWVGAMPLLGRTDAPTLRTLAEAARRHSGGELRLTPWRGVVLATDAGWALVKELRAAGLVVDAGDPAAHVVACTGTRGCTSGLTDALGDAHQVIAARRAAGAPAEELHVSGCGKRCAQATPLDLNLIGVGSGRYDMYGGDKLEASGVPAADVIARTTEAAHR